MTRGRAANCKDMCALRKINLQPVQRFSRNTRNGRGQCGQIASSGGGKFCRRWQQLPGPWRPGLREKPRFYWVFGDGTALADT
jgi:hypothetical protein